MGCDTDSLIGKAQTMNTSKTKQEIHSPLPIIRQLFRISRKAELHHAEQRLGKIKHHHSKHMLPLPSFLSSLILSVTSQGMEYGLEGAFFGYKFGGIVFFPALGELW